MGLFKKKDKQEKQTSQSNQSENNKDKTNNNKDKQENQINPTNKLRIKIYRYMGEDLAVQVGKPILAEEKRDENNNLLALNEKAFIKEDLNFSIDRIYEIMNFSLNLQNKSKKEKAAILKKAINKQETFLNSFENDIELNAKYNYRDEELKLKQLKIFYDSLRKEKRGNYLRIGEDGVREFEFVVIDGILYPYFFGSKKFRVYPDLLVKKKIFNHENTVFKNETAALFQSTLNWMIVVLYVFGVLLIAVNLGVGYWVYQKNANIDEEINKGSVTCLNTLGTFTANYGSVLESYMRNQVKNSQTQSENTQSNINTEIPIINIDPNKNNQNK
jgi:hypothetical protein